MSRYVTATTKLQAAHPTRTDQIESTASDGNTCDKKRHDRIVCLLLPITHVESYLFQGKWLPSLIGHLLIGFEMNQKSESNEPCRWPHPGPWLSCTCPNSPSQNFRIPGQRFTVTSRFWDFSRLENGIFKEPQSLSFALVLILGLYLHHRRGWALHDYKILQASTQVVFKGTVTGFAWYASSKATCGPESFAKTCDLRSNHSAGMRWENSGCRTCRDCYWSCKPDAWRRQPCLPCRGDAPPKGETVGVFDIDRDSSWRSVSGLSE